jgi:hypothetical protein
VRDTAVTAAPVAGRHVMASRFCRHCRKLVPSNQWIAHRQACYRRANPSPRARHSSSAAWKRLRLAILERDRWTCQAVGCYEPASEVHHIDGDWRNDSPSNLISVCSAHNPRGARAGSAGHTTGR